VLPAKPAPIFLVGNKCDCYTEREVSRQEGFFLAKQLGCQFVKASAENCENVEKPFYDVVRQLRSRRRESSGKTKEKTATVSSSRTYNQKDRDNGGRNQRNKQRNLGTKCVIL